MRTAVLAAILAIVAFGTMADKCTFAPNGGSTPPASQKEEAPKPAPEAPKAD